ncbi:hypothetical protein F5B17DRAFT_435550 [Nemania serpens]|nr:hypothetical protein F5B17DRAFT_435550 [Nemania serpens]
MVETNSSTEEFHHQSFSLPSRCSRLKRSFITNSTSPLACPAIEDEDEHVPDEARFYTAVCEPVAVQPRRLGEGNMKLTWWYVAAVNEDEPTGQHDAHRFEVEILSFEEAVKKLTFKGDRELVNSTLPSD